MCGTVLQEANDPDDDVLTRDAVALQSVMKTAIRQVKNEAARTAKANKVRLQAAVRAAGVYAAREVRRWETRPGTALAKRKRARSSGSKVAEDEDEDGSTYRDDWEVVAGRSGANTIVLQLPHRAVRLSELFGRMEARPEAAQIVHWSLRQPSLEEVFLKLSRLAEAEQLGLISGAAAEGAPERAVAVETHSTAETLRAPSPATSTRQVAPSTPTGRGNGVDL